jgi:AcrR family transcriptional regulator
MGIEARKEREKEQRRQQIVDAAERVIFAKGLEQTTMDEIAEQAELSKGTLYLYFKNKNELYMAICERGSNVLNSRFAKIFTGNYTGLELIRKMGETYLGFVRNNPDYFRAFKYYESLNDAKELGESTIAQTCEEHLREAMTYMVRALQIGMQDGTIDDSYDPRELAIMIWASTRGITMISHTKQTGHHFKMLDEMDINMDSLFENFLNLIGTGLATEKGRNQKMTNSHFSETSAE